MNSLSKTAPSAVFLRVLPNVTTGPCRLPVKQKAILPPSVLTLASRVPDVPSLVQLLKAIRPEIVGYIERETLGQGKNPAWLEQRKGRITASHFHDVDSGMRNRRGDVGKLISRVLGRNPPPKDLPALKYGREMEEEARHMLKNELLKAGHRDVLVEDAGLFILDTDPYIGASPDAIVTCACCGISLAEIKCPLRAAASGPVVEELEFLTVLPSGDVTLAKRHTYFTQVQGQLGVSHVAQCFFFVYSRHGSVLTKIDFDPMFWEAVLKNLKIFFVDFLAPELISG